jgi:VCBS repeat-containing protein
MNGHGVSAGAVRGRARRLLVVLGSALGLGLLAIAAQAVTPPAYAATASLTPALYYVNDSAGSIYTFTVKNTGTTTNIGAVEIDRPSGTWSITGCPSAPAGWSVQSATTQCRFRSVNSTSDDIKPGQSRTFAVRAKTAAGNVNVVGTWKVVVSKSNQFDNPSLLKNASPAGAGLTTTLYVFELTDAVVYDGVVLPGGACPPAAKEAIVGSTHTIVVCGKNRANAALTPTSAYSSLSGSFIAAPGTFSSGPIVANSGNVVLAKWTGTTITSSFGTGKKVIAQVGSAANRTSPLRTFTDYSATSEPPDANDDSYSTNEDTPLTVSAPGVLGNDTDAESDPLTAVLVSGPSHAASFSLSSNGSFSYTPNANFNGSDSFTYKANDTHSDSAPATVTITVNSVNDIPVANDDSQSVSEDSTGDTVNVLANDTDADGDGLTITAVDTTSTTGTVTNNGDDVTYDPNGQFEYLAAGETATDTFTYTVSDGSGGTDTATVTITVTGANDSPVAGDDAYSTNEDTPLVVAAPGVLANDTDADDSVTATNASDPAHGDVTLNADGSFTYTPDANYHGSDSFTYDASDGTTTDEATVSITVNSVNDVPVANDDSQSVSEDSTGDTVDVLANDTDADGDGLTISAVDTTSTTGTVTNNGDDVTYDPNGQFEYLAAGETATDTFTYTVSDGSGGTDTATVTITITGANDSPVAGDDAYSTNEDTQLVVPAPGVLTNDTDADSSNTVTATNASDPAHGDVTLGADGSFTYTPDANYHGSDSFTYDASDGTTTDSATVSITVNSVNDIPVANDDSQSVSENSTGDTVDVLANDTDADGDGLTITDVDTTSTTGSVTNNGDDVTYDPNGQFEYLAAGETATDTFTYTVSDGSGGTDTATVTITITGANDAPVALDDSGYSTLQDTQLVVPAPGVLANDTDADTSDTLTAGNASDPANGSVTLNADGSFTYDPDSGFAGTDTFTYDVSDGTTTDSATVTIEVVLPNATPTAGATSASGNEDGGAITVTLTGNDTDDDNLTFTAGTASNGAVGTPTSVNCSATDDCTATVTYTPNANFNGSDSFTYTVNDGTISSAPATASITVNPVNDAPSFTKGSDPTVNEDSGEYTAAGWATLMSPGPANESGQTVTGVFVSSTNDALFSVFPAVSSNGTLTFTPAVNANGSATVTMHAHDDGGTANGGVDNGSNFTFVVTVNAVNDAPSFTKSGGDQTVNEDAGAQTVNAWATAMSRGGGTDENGQTLTFVLTNDNTALFSAAPAISSSTGNLTFTPAANQHGVANLTVKLTDNGGTANGGSDTSGTVSLVITVNSVNDAPVAATKTYTAQSNMKINLRNLLTGATDPNDVAGDASWTPTFTVGTVALSTGCSACTVTNVGAANGGSFDFEPAPGVTGTVHLTYTVVDNGTPAPGVESAPVDISITVNSPVIWFVDGTSGSDTNDGTLAHPFKTLGKAATVDGVNHRIFLYPGTYTDGITLNNGEWLEGAGSIGTDFDTLNGLTVPANTIARPAINGARPTISGNVVLNNASGGNTLHGLTLSGNPALSGTSFGTLTLGAGGNADVALSSTGQALSLTTGTVSGDFLSTSASGGTNNVLLSTVATTGTSLGSGALSGATSEGFKVLNGAGTWTYSGTVGSTTGADVSISGMTGGGVTFSGAVSDATGPGVSITTSTGAYSFTGGVTLTSGTSNAFVATDTAGGATGSITVTGASNTLATTTGTALNIANMNIGAPDVTFQKIDANGATVGISLDTTGSSGNLSVTGTGTTGGSGGTIQNGTGADMTSNQCAAVGTPTGTGIFLRSTQDVSLKNMNLHDFSNFAILGYNVTNLTLDRAVVNGTNGSNEGVDEDSVHFCNLLGSATISNSTITGGYEDSLRVYNTSGTLNRLTVSDTTVATRTANIVDDAFLATAFNSATMNVTLNNVTATTALGDLFQYALGDTSTGDLVITNSHFSNNHPAISGAGGGVTVGAGGVGTNTNFTYNINGSSFRDSHGNGLTLFLGSGTSSGTVTNNTFGVTGVSRSAGYASAIGYTHIRSGTAKVSITNNTIKSYGADAGIRMLANDGSPTLRTTITGNSITEPSTVAGNQSFAGITVEPGALGTDAVTMCLDMGGASALQNSVSTGDPANFNDINLVPNGNTTVDLPGWSGGTGPDDTTSVANYLIARNSGDGAPTAFVDQSFSGNSSYLHTQANCL